jgi:hypothetical protein
MDLVVAQNLEVPPHLLLQLEEILKYSKVSTGSAAVGSSRATDPSIQHPALQRFPGLSLMVSSLEGFRNGLKKQDWTQKSVEGKFMFPN